MALIPGLVHMVLGAGQSQMSGVGTGVEAPRTDFTKVAEWGETAGTLIEIYDPSSSIAPYKAQTGSLFPEFANTYQEATGDMVVMVRAAAGGTSLLAENPTDKGTWDPEYHGVDARYDASVELYLDCRNWLISNGFTIGEQSIIWSQGFADAKQGHGLIRYADVNVDIIEAWQEDLGVSDMVLYMDEMYRPGAASVDDEMGDRCWFVRDAQHEAMAEKPDHIKMAFNEGYGISQLGFPEGTKWDGLHFQQTWLNYMGRKMANFVAADQGFGEAEPPVVETPGSSVAAYYLRQVVLTIPPPPPEPAQFEDVAYRSIANGVDTVNIPKSELGTLEVGDWLVAHCFGNGTTPTWSADDFTKVAETTASSQGLLIHKIEDLDIEDDEPNYTFVRSGVSSTAGVVVWRISGAHADDPIDQVAFSHNSSGSTLTLTGIDVGVDGATLCHSVARSVAATGAWDGPIPEDYNAQATTSNLSVAGATEVVEDGLTGDKTWTLLAGLNTQKRGCLFSVIPAGA